MACEIVDRYVETEIDYVLRNGEYTVSDDGSKIMYKRSKVWTTVHIRNKVR